MSISAAAGQNGLKATTHLSSSTSCTKLVWAKHGSAPGGYNPFLSSYNGAVTAYNEIDTTTSSETDIRTEAGTNAFASHPTLTNWVCYAMTMTTAGAGSVIGYWQDNAGGGWVTKTNTGSAFTNANDIIGGAINSLNVAMTFAFYMEWTVVLSAANLSTQFLSSAPVVQTANATRYCPMTNHTSAGTDSQNGYNFTVIGSVSDGASLPTFPIGALLLASNQGGF